MNDSRTIRNHRILVIDHEMAIYEEIKKILCPQKTGPAATQANDAPVHFNVESASRDESALRLIDSAAASGHPYAMAFVDVPMAPGWDGVEIVARIWNRCPDLQVVLCTAHPAAFWDALIRVLGRADSLLILKKPFDSIEVLQLASALTRKWSLNHELACRLQDLDRLVAARTAELKESNDRLTLEIAEHIRLEKQLRQAQKMEAVGQLAAGVAHDFNNMLTVVQGNASLLMANKAPGCAEWQPLQNICSAADRAAAMVGRLLSFCRKQAVELRPTNLGDALAHAARTLAGAMPPGIKVDAQAAAGLPLISADGDMVETLLMNLATNANEAMPQGGLLRIIAAPVTLSPEEVATNSDARSGHFVRVSVIDTGRGIPSEILPRIFEPFFTTKTIGKGSGLGLATVYGIVAQHSGWVEVQSQVNHGTSIHVFFPVLAPVHPRKASASAGGSKRMATRETILVVDDEPDLRELVAQVLETGGYRVVTAASGSEALAKWAGRSADIHLLLTDIVMPDGLTGSKLAERLRKEDPRLRVIYTSGYSAGTPGTELANVDERSFLAKPYRPATLLRFVRECLDRPCDSIKAAKKAA